MKYYKLGDVIHAFELDCSQDDFISDEMVLMTESEIDRHINPQKYMSDEEKLQFSRQNMPTLSPIEFDLKLIQHNLYDAVQTLIASDTALKIAYSRATFFSRTDSFVDQARIALGLTDEQVDAMWG